MAGGVQVQRDGWIPAGPFVQEVTSLCLGAPRRRGGEREVGSCRWKAPAGIADGGALLERSAQTGLVPGSAVGDPGRQAPRPRIGTMSLSRLIPEAHRGGGRQSDPGDREEDGRVVRPVRRSQPASRGTFGALWSSRGTGVAALRNLGQQSAGRCHWDHQGRRGRFRTRSKVSEIDVSADGPSQSWGLLSTIPRLRMARLSPWMTRRSGGGAAQTRESERGGLMTPTLSKPSVEGLARTGVCRSRGGRDIGP